MISCNENAERRVKIMRTTTQTSNFTPKNCKKFNYLNDFYLKLFAQAIITNLWNETSYILGINGYIWMITCTFAYFVSFQSNQIFLKKLL